MSSIVNGSKEVNTKETHNNIYTQVTGTLEAFFAVEAFVELLEEEISFHLNPIFFHYICNTYYLITKYKMYCSQV